MTINDSIYLLDEVLSKLPKIRETELAMQDRATWMQQDQVLEFLSLSVALYSRKIAWDRQPEQSVSRSKGEKRKLSLPYADWLMSRYCSCNMLLNIMHPIP